MSGSRDRMDPFVGLVGWLFADVLLGLAMLYFAIGTTASPGPRPTPTVAPPTETPGEFPTATPEPTAAPVPVATATPMPRLCVDPKPVIQTISIDVTVLDTLSIKDLSDNVSEQAISINRNILQELSQKFSEEERQGLEAGFVMVFGGTSSGMLGLGPTRAARLEPGMKQSPMFRRAAFATEFHDLKAGTGRAELRVHFSRPCQQ